MGRRLHVATEYKVEYSDGLFNYSESDVYCFLSKTCSYVWSSEEYSPEYGDDLEVNKEELKAAIENWKGKTNEDFENEFEGEKLELDIAVIVKNLETLLEQAEPSIDYVRFAWF